MNIRGINFSTDQNGNRIGAKTISESLAVTQYNIYTGTAQNHTLNAATRICTITVSGYPVKLKADEDAAADDYDHYLVIAQYEMPVEEGVTKISLIADGGTASVTIVERKDV